MKSKKVLKSRSHDKKQEAEKSKHKSKHDSKPSAKASKQKSKPAKAADKSTTLSSVKNSKAKKGDAPVKKSSSVATSKSRKQAISVGSESKPKKRKTVSPLSPPSNDSDRALREAGLTVSLVNGKNSKTLRPKLFEQLPVEKGYGFPSSVPELPETYHRDRLVLMTKEPDFLFSYWEITPELLAAKSADKHGGEQYHEVLKLNWPARSLFDVNFALLPVQFTSRRWYVQAPIAGLSYQVDLGWLGSEGHFIVILGSNETESPENWDTTLERLRGLGEPLNYNVRLAQPLGASEHMQIVEKNFSLTDWNMSSGIFSSSSPVRKAPSSLGKTEPAIRNLPAELRVEAQLKPGSLLRVGGHDLAADADGKVLAHIASEESLTVELVLPGGRRHSYTYDLAAMTR